MSMVEAAAEGPAFPWERAYPADVDWHARIDRRPLFDILDDAVARYADRPCTDFLGRRLSYRAIGALTDRAAKGLQALGVTKGTRVGLFLPNTPYFIVCYYAVLKCGGVVVNFNPLYAEREIAAQIGDAGVELMVTLDLAVLHDKLKPMLGSTPLQRVVLCRMADLLPFPKNVLFPFVKMRDLARVPDDGRHLWFDRLTANDGAYAKVAVSADDLAVLQYTGGTTGLPKGAMLSHGNLYANTVQSVLWFAGAVPGEERILGVLPFFHVFAMTVVMNLGLYLGAEIIMLPRFEAERAMKTIHDRRPTLLPGVPTIFNAISTHPSLKKYDISSLRMCISGGAALPVEVKQRFEAVTGCTLIEGYGLSETSPVATANPLRGLNKTGSIGLPLPGTVIEIVSLEDRSRVLPPGERGEVCIRGPQVMRGYWRRPEETADALLDGRLHTDDVGTMDAEGYTYIVDRIKDLILCSGFNVYPRQVEEAVYLHPAVRECVVAGMPDDYRGQTVKAYVALNEGHDLTLRELAAFLKDKLSPMEIPKQLEIRDELPKTLIGKLSRKALLEEEMAKREKEESSSRRTG